MAKKKQIRNVLCFLVMIVIFMSVMPVSVFAVNDSDNTIGVSNSLNELENTFTKKSPSSGDCAPAPDADLPEIYLNDTPECVPSNDSGNDTNIIILTDVSEDTRETVSALGCDVYVKIDDPCCVGYRVYVDGAYKFTEGGDGTTPDGFCAFHVCAGTHTIKITKNGRSASKTKNFQCGYTYRWTSMPNCWCEDGGGSDDCKYPPTVKFDKTKYYEGNTVHATVSTSQSSVYYKIKDCGGTVRKSGTTSNGKKISYTIPKGASKCCYWQICFYWDEYIPPMALAGAGGEVTAQSGYDCTKCYNFYVCPVQTCEVYVKIEDPCCVGYKVYVDGVYQFTEGGDGTPPDGYCAFRVKEGTHTLKISKNGRSASKTINFECNIVYRWVSMPKNWCGDGEAYVEIKDKYCKGYEVYVDDVYQFTEGRSGTPDGNCGFFVGEGTHTIEIRKNGRSASLNKYFESSYRYTWVSMPDYWCDPCYDPPIVTFDNPPDYQGDKPKYSGGDKLSATVSTSQSSVYYDIKDCGGTVLTNGYTSNAGKISYTIPTSVSTCCYWTICFYWSGDGGGWLAGGQDPAQYYDCIECYTFYVCPDPCYDPPIVTFINPPDYEGDKPKYSEGDTVHATVSSSHGSVYYAIKDCNGKVQTTGSAGDGDSITYLIPRVELTDCCYWTICFYWGGNGGWLATGVDPAQSYDCTKCYTFEVCPICTANVKIDDDTCVGYNVYVDDVYQLTEGVGETLDGYCAFDVIEGVHNIEIRDNECFASIRRYFECGSTYLWVSMSDNWCKCKNCPSEVRFEGTAKTDELAGLVCYKTYYCEVIVDQILYDPDNTLQVGNVYTVGYGDDPKNIAAGDKIVVNGTYYHNCGPFGAYGRICGDLWKDLPDLIIDDIKLPSGTVCLGDRIPITVTVKNIGGDKANQSVVKYYVGNKYIDRDTVPSLVPNATSNQTFNWTANSCGNISVMAIADANHTVHECNESNNDKQKRIEASGPDLITHIWPIGTAGRVCLGEPITFTVTVINTGDCTAGQSVVKYYAGGEYIDSELIPSLSPGAASTQTFTWTASSCGNVSVRAVADASHEVRECDENNNDKAKSVKVDGPDMIIPDITLPSRKICLGQPVTITVTVKNEGGCTAGASTVKYFVDNKYVDSDSIPSLDPGAASSQTFTWTASSCGDVPVKAVADANNEVTECDENNNEKAKTVRVDGPDLIIEDIIVPTGKICLGLPVTITVTVKNQGGCPAGASAVKYFVDNKYVDSDSIPSLDPGASSTQTFTWTADSCGNVSVKGVADANNDVRECDENNNEKQKSIEVDGPDLIIQDITWPSGKICLDNEIEIEVTTANVGKCDAEKPFKVTLYIENKEIENATIASLDAGNKEKATFSWIPDTCGILSIKAVADVDNTINECDENNNEKQKSIEVDGPDLIIQNITWPSGKICLDNEIEIEVTTANVGKCDAEKPFKVTLYIENKEIENATIDSLGAGNQENTTFSWIPDTCGILSIKAVADVDNTIHECDENNNEKQKSIEVDGPDLIIQDITWPSGKICLDKEIEIEVTTANVGKCDAEKPFKVTLYVENKEIENATISFLGAGNQEKTTFSWKPDTCGILSIKAVADVDNTIHECDENNNEKQKSIEVDGPDLIIHDITWPSGKICLDKEIEIEVTTANVGKCDAEKPFKVTLYIENKAIENVTIASLGAGNQEKTTFSWIPDTCGILSIKAVADVDNTIHECDENNNEKQKSIEVDGPDLIIQEITWPSGTICLDHEIEIEVTTANVGKCDAEKPFKMKLYVESKEIGTATIDFLGAGDTEKTPIKWTPDTCGILSIKAAADVDNSIHECDENNNEKQKSIEVDGPDLIIQDISLPSGTICLNSPVNIEVTTANIGGCPATKQFTVMLYVASKELTATIKNLEAGATTKSTFDWIPDACGNHNLKAVADPNGDIHECNEGNNENQKDIKVEGPDLIVKEISPASDLLIGVTTDINIVVENQGECSAIPFIITYAIDGKESLIPIPVTSFLSPHTTETVHFSWTPNSCGSHQIIVNVDPEPLNIVRECNEDNNKKTQSVDVKGPDLIVEPITVSQPTTIGTQIKFTVVIRNKGTADAGSSYMRCYVDESPIGDKISVPAINRGQSSTHDVSWTASGCGPHTFKAVADVDLNVIECDEENNDKQTSFTVKCPDLIIESITLSPGSPAPNQQVTFSVVVKNKGDADADDSTLKCIVDSTAICTESAGKIPSGKTSTRSCTWTGSGCAEHNFKAVADAVGNKVTESDETNNEKIRAFSVVDSVKPTITIDSPSNGDTSSSSSITVEGTASDNSGVAKVEVKVNDGEWQQASGTTSWSKTVSLSEGTNTITVKATDVCGNEQSASITVYYTSGNRAPVITSITADPTVVGQGESSTITVVASDPDGDELSYSYDPTGGEISGGGSEVTWTADVAASGAPPIEGLFKVYVTVSDGEKSASGSVDITVTSEDKPDLIINDITWTPANPQKGDSVSITVITKNSGNADADDASHTRLFIKHFEVDSTSSPVGPIAKGATVSNTFTWTADSCASTAVRAIADADKEVDEFRDDNNDLPETIYVVCPDLEITDISWSPEGDELHAGDDVTLSYKIRNKGDADAKEFTTSILIDSSPFGTIRQSLSANTEMTVEVGTWKAVDGSHTIRVIADSQEDVDESDESDEDNEESKEILVGVDPVDLTITGIEVTQAIQNLDNEVPLIAGKDTWVLVYVKSVGGSIEITGDLYRIDGSDRSYSIGPACRLFDTIETSQSEIKLSDRANVLRCLQFHLPPDWTHGKDIEFEVEISGKGSTAIEKTRPLSFVEMPPLKINLVLVKYVNILFESYVPDITTDYTAVYNYLKMMYPINDIETWTRGTITFGYNPTSSDVLSCMLLNTLSKMDDDIDEPDENTIWLGLVDPDIPVYNKEEGYIGGTSYEGSDVCWAIGGVSDSDVAYYSLVPHEIGHTLGLYYHVECPEYSKTTDPEDKFIAYPFPDGKIGDFSSKGYCGMDGGLFTGGLFVQPFEPNRYYDVMTYCHPQWISNQIYISIKDAISANFAMESSGIKAFSTFSKETSSEYFMVSGIINTTSDFVILDPIYRITKNYTISISEVGMYSIELQNSSRYGLIEHFFCVDTSPKQSDVGGFVELLPYLPDTSRIVIKHNSIELASVTVSDHTPNVTVISPNGGETLSGVVNVSWMASDLDGDELHYIVEYSPDNGSTWQMLVTDFNETKFPLNTAYLQGSTEGLIRITASDDVNTGSDISDAVFTVLEKPPEVAIVNPTSGTTLTEGNYISFSGAGYDLEDGILDDSALTWSSDQTGVLGTGSDLRVKILTRGVHTITLMGEDRDGNRGTDQITIYVIDSATIDTPKGTARLSVTDGVFIGACRANESLLPALSGVEFPFGVFTFNISKLSNGQTVNVSIGLPQDPPSDAKYWQYGRTISDTNPHWYEIPMAVSEDNRTVTIQLTDGGVGDDDMTADGVIVYAGGLGVPAAPVAVFDTGPSANPYPSINGTHNGTIRLNQTIEVQKLHTYPCADTKGHTEYARIWNATLNATAIWTDYEGDWHNITFDNTFTLVAGEPYNYSIRTGSYPQIHHTDNLTTANGYITCTEFIDAGGKRNSTHWIPAIRLFP